MARNLRTPRWTAMSAAVLLAAVAPACGGDDVEQGGPGTCGTIQATIPSWTERTTTIPPNSSAQASFALSGIGPAPTCAVRVPLPFACGRPGDAAPAPPGQPSAACVPLDPRCFLGCGPFSITIETTLAGTYELWLAPSWDGAEIGPPQSGPLEVVVQ